MAIILAQGVQEKRHNMNKIQQSVNNSEIKLANSHTNKGILAPKMKIIIKSLEIGLKPRKEKKFNLLQKLNGRIFFASKKTVISFIPDYPSACKPKHTHKRSPRCCIT
jgi:hypothetical protein